MRHFSHSLRGKIILLFFAVVAIQAAIIGLFISVSLKPRLMEDYKQSQRQMTNALGWEFGNLRGKIQTYSVNILSDRRVQAFLKSAGENTHTPGLTNEMRNIILAYTDYEPGIRDIFLVDINGNIYGNNIRPQLSEYIGGNMEDVAKSDGSAVWRTDYDPGTVIMRRRINGIDHDLTEMTGAMFMVIDLRMFTDVAAKFLPDDRQRYMLADSEGRFSVGHSDEFGRIASASADWNDGQSPYSFCVYGTQNWKLYTWTEKSAVFKPVNDLLTVLLWELLAALILAGVLVLVISGRLTRPIKLMKHAMYQLGNGNLGYEVEVHHGDEIGELEQSLNSMSRRIGILVEQIREQELRRRVLELKTLQYQINPHFLYNTLDSINMTARKNNDLEVSELVTSLSDLFRLALNHGQDFVSVEDEFTSIRHYLKIQSLRFPGAFEWRATLPPEARGLKILNFLLQPLVENSINHGLRGSVERGIITVEASKNESAIELTVSDNGTGMSPETLHELLGLLDEPDLEKNPFKGGLGLRNVHQRLKLCYGEDNGLSITSEWGEGTTVSINIPISEPNNDPQQN